MKILITGAGGTPTENVISSFLECKKEEDVIGIGSEISDFISSRASKKYIVPYAEEVGYKNKLIEILNKEKPNLLHSQNDIEIFEISKMRVDILLTGTKLFMPTHDVIDKCVDKSKLSDIWMSSGVKIPKTINVKTEKDLKKSFDK